MFKNLLKKALQEQKREDGQGLVEYALILVLVAVVVIVVLSLVGPAVGNIFSEVVGALEGGASGNIANVAEDDSSGPTCLNTNLANNHMEVPANGALPQGTLQHSDPECTAGDRGGITFDSVYVSPSSIASASAKCNEIYGKDIRFPGDASSEIWVNSGFWYCTP